MKEIGIDLAGVDTNQTGFAILLGTETRTKVLFSNTEIIEEVVNWEPSIVSIDAPLSKPLKGYTRSCERQLLKMRVQVFPCMFTQMKGLTERGIYLAERIRSFGYKVIESYPGAAQDILGIARKGKSKEALQKGLWKKFRITGDIFKADITDHELDAITSAIVGKMYLAGETISIGDEKEGLMVIPKQSQLADFAKRKVEQK